MKSKEALLLSRLGKGPVPTTEQVPPQEVLTIDSVPTTSLDLLKATKASNLGSLGTIDSPPPGFKESIKEIRSNGFGAGAEKPQYSPIKTYLKRGK